MKTIGLIADTHDFFDPQLPACFSDCHEIWHLGDIGQPDILTQLNLIAPTRAVYGNIDPNELRWSLPENEVIELEGLRFLLTHIAGKPPRYTSRVKKLLNDHTIDVLLCGHSHMQAVIKDKERNLVFINPGAAGRQGFHLFRTVMKIWVDNKKITNLEVLRLGRK